MTTARSESSGGNPPFSNSAFWKGDHDVSVHEVSLNVKHSRHANFWFRGNGRQVVAVAMSEDRFTAYKMVKDKLGAEPRARQGVRDGIGSLP